MTHLLDELHAFWLGQDLLNREWALHPRCNTRRQTQCPVFSFGASAGLEATPTDRSWEELNTVFSRAQRT